MSLCLGAELSYVENANGRFGSNKFYKAVLAGNSVFTSYGRRGGRAANFGVKHFGTTEDAAAEMWRVLRSKTAKGYHVVDAAAFRIDDDVIAAASSRVRGFAYPDRTIIGKWDAEQYGERREARQAILRHPDLKVRSPRTPREGRGLLVALLAENCDGATLMQCALADPSERFLVPLGLSHPACSDDIRVAHFLAGGQRAGALALA